MMMNRSSFCRLIKSIIPSSSSFADGSLIRTLKQYHTSSTAFTPTLNHNPNIQDETETETELKPEPFSITDPNLIQNSDGNHRWTDEKPSYKILGPGMILLKNYIPLKDQVDIVNTCQKLGVGPGGFYSSRPEKGTKYLMCFGRNWDPETAYKNRCRRDGSKPPPIPYKLIHLAKTAIEDTHDLASLDTLYSMTPDICMVHFHSCFSRVGLHQDNEERDVNIRKGLPVVSISIGDAAKFMYCHTRNTRKLQRVWLKSGDVLIYGGKSRLLYHGVQKITARTSPQPLVNATGLMPGCLYLTLKKY